MYYKLKNVHKCYVENRYYICIWNIGEFDENNKFIRFLPMDEAYAILDGWVVDSKLKKVVASKADKKKSLEARLIDNILDDMSDLSK